MTPLLFAAVTALSPAGAQPIQAYDPSVTKPPLMRVLPGASAKLCAAGAVAIIGPDGLPLTKLNELPPGLVEHAVLRTVNGCPVREVVFAGQTYYIEGADTQTVERLEGKRLGQR
jgi:hypothetical protein